MYRITVTKIDDIMDAVSTTPRETEVFRQTVDDLDIRKFARDINKTPRTRKVKTPRAAT